LTHLKSSSYSITKHNGDEASKVH